MITKIKNGCLIFPDKEEKDLNLYIEDGKIKAITNKELEFDNVIDVAGNYVAPGFIDIHVHGGGGSDFSDGGVEAVVKAADTHLMYGTTSILPTTLACSSETLIEILNDIKEVKEKNLSQGRILGVHLEGPYFSLSQSGAQNPDYIKAPDKEEYENIINKFGDLILRWSFAPELDGSEEFCKTIAENGILPSIAHSDAIYADVKKVYDLSCRSFTHLYSGMSMVTRENGFRRLGVVESAYLLPDIMAEVIADGCHLPADLLKLIIKILSTDNICMVTDAMRAAGMGEGKSYLGRKGEEMPCIVEQGVAFVMDKSGFAGSVATTDRLVRTMVNEVGMPVYEAVKMITKNPAKHLGISNLGELNEGNIADIVVFDKNISVQQVLVGGKEIEI